MPAMLGPARLTAPELPAPDPLRADSGAAGRAGRAVWGGLPATGATSAGRAAADAGAGALGGAADISTGGEGFCKGTGRRTAVGGAASSRAGAAAVGSGPAGAASSG